MMEHTGTRGFAAIVQILSEPPPPPSAYVPSSKPPAWQHRPPAVHQPVNNPNPTSDVVCPLPVRPVRAPCLVDNANRLVYCAGSTTNGYRDTFHQAEMELLDFLLGGQDGGGFDGNGDDDGAGFFLGTPPARTGNPIVNDAEFRKQSFAAAGSPYYQCSATPSPRGERGSNSGSYGSSSASSFTGVPSVRVEGFPSSASDPHPRRRVVSALA